MSTLVEVVVTIGVAIASAAALTLGIRRLFPNRPLLSNEGGSPALRALTAIYSLLIAFVLLTALQSFQNARQQTASEAGAVVSMANLATLAPQPSRSGVRKSLACYAETVVNSEFPAMRAGRAVPADDTVLENIYRALPNPASPPAATGGLTQAMLSQLSTITSARDVRIRAAHTSLPLFLWLVVIGGAVAVLLAVAAVTVIDRPWPQFSILTAIALVVVGAILLIGSLESPFASGPVSVSSGPMESAFATVSEGLSPPYCAATRR
jgi:hypothetical protein